MLSTADAQLVRRDADVPGLALVLDSSRLVEAIGLLMPQATVTKASCHYLQYKPGTSCLAAFHVTLNGRHHDLAIQAFRSNESEKLRKATRQRVPLRSNTAAVVPSVLPHYATVIWEFLHDRRLPGLGRLFDGKYSLRLLQNLLASHGTVGCAQIQSIRYKPHRRFVGRMSLESGTPILLKCYDRRGYAAAQRNAKVFSSRGPLRVARRLARSNRHRVVASQWLPGALLADRLADSAAGVPLALLSEVGTALGELHTQNAVGLRCETLENTALAVHQTAVLLGNLLPECGPRFRGLAQRIGATLVQMPRAYQSTHGDFYPQQILTHEGKVGILDLDRGVLADPASDLGNFIAHLDYEVLRGRYRQADFQRMVDALIEGYCLTSEPSIINRIATHASAALFRLATVPFRSRDQDWPLWVDRVVRRAAGYLHRAPHSKTVLATRTEKAASPPRFQRRDKVLIIDPFDVRNDQRMPFLGRAMDPDVMKTNLDACLAHIIKGRGELIIRSIRVTRYKPARRCLIEYHLGRNADHESVIVLGKIQAKRLKPERFALFRSIRDAGFTEGSGTDVAVPEPLAILPQLHMWVQRKVCGSTATNFLMDPGSNDLVLRIADALGKLHKAGVAAPATHAVRDELALLDDRLSMVAHQFPHWSQRISRLLEWLHASERKLDPYTPRGIHRDFYSDQVIVDGQRLYLIDFDLYASGDPALDAGNFLGHLVEFGLRYSGSERMLSELHEAFASRFLQQTPETSRRNVELFTTFTLARHIHLSTRFPNRRHLTQRLLEICEHRAQQAWLAH